MSINVFDLWAKLSIDSKNFDETLDKESGKIEGFGSKIGGVLGGIGTAVGTATIAAVGAAAGGVVTLTKQAVDGYAEYEQLIGGVETLFQDSADTIMDYAENSYKTAGVSANKYMEMATSFSGALIKATGRGVQTNLEELEASLDAEYTATKRTLEDEYKARQEHWKKVVDQSKYSSKATQESLKKQRDEDLKALKRANEDQLKELKQHNKDLIAEAEASNMVSVTTSESLAEAAGLTQMAITDMADQANKYGKTVEEVSVVYSGLSRGIYSTLDNLFGGMFAGTKSGLEEMLRYAENYRAGLGETVSYSIDSYADIVNAIHDVSVSLGVSGITAEEAAELVASGAMTQEEAYALMGTTAKEAMTTIEGSTNAFKSAWDNLVTGLANPNADLGTLIDNVVRTGETALENLIPVIEQALTGIGEAVEKIAPIIAEKLPPLVTKILPSVLSAIKSLVNGIIKSLPAILQVLIQVAPDLINTIIETALELLPEIIELGLELVITLAEGIADSLPKLIPAVIEAITTIVQKLTEPQTLERLINAALQIILALALGLIQAVPDLIRVIPQIIQNLVQAFIAEYPQILSTAFQMMIQFGAGIVEAIPELLTCAMEIVYAIVGGIRDGIGDVMEVGADIVRGLWDGIKGTWDWLVSSVSGAFSGLIDSAKNLLGINSPSKIFAEIGDNMALGLGEGFEDTMRGVSRDIQDITSDAIPTVETPTVSGSYNAYGHSYDNAFSGAGYGSGNIIINIDGSGLTVEEISEELGTAVRRQFRRSGVYA